MAKSVKRKRSLTKAKLAVRLDVIPQTINRWATEGMPVAERGRGGRGSRYDFEACHAWVEARKAASANGEPADFLRERARKERARALLDEQLYATRAGELLKRDDVERTWLGQVSAVRTRLLAWSTTLADHIFRAAVTDGVAGVERELALATRQVLEELAQPAPRRSRRKKAEAITPATPTAPVEPSVSAATAP